MSILSFSVDFDELREQAIDGIFAVAGQIVSVVEDTIDQLEEIYERLPDAE